MCWRCSKHKQHGAGMLQCCCWLTKKAVFCCSGDRQVHFGSTSREYCGRLDARADSLRAGLQPFAWRSGIGVTRSAPAEKRAHTVLRALLQNSTSVLESMNAASTTHLLLWHSAVVTLARLSDPHGEYQRTVRALNERPAGPVNGRTWLAFDRDIYRQVIARAVQHWQ